MKLRNAALAAAGGVGATAVVNRVLGGRAESLSNPLPGDEGTYRWRGFDVAYTEAGDPADPDLLLLHGVNAAAWSDEWRAVFADLADSHHVIAPDLPGFGRSDRPPLLYSGSLLTTFVEDVAADLTDDAVCVASSLTGAYATVAAHSVRFSELVLVCPTASTVPGRRVWLRSLLRSPVLGEALYNGLTSRASMRYFNRDHAYYDPRHVDDDLLERQWQTTHQPGARFAPASFVSGFLDLDVDLGERLATLEAPVTLVWGREADITPLSDGQALADAADARLVVFDDSRLLPHVEHPEQFVEVVRGELPRAEH